MRRHAQHHVNLLQRFLIAQRQPCMGARHGTGRRQLHRRQALKMLAHQRYQPLMREVARGRHNQVPRYIDGTVIVPDHGMIEALHGLGRP